MRRSAFLLSFALLALPGYAQLAPIISGITPSSGPAAGGTEVMIIGSGFEDFDCRVTCPPVPLIDSLTIGGIQILSWELTDTTIRFTTPPHPPGEVEIVIHTFNGLETRTTFLYVDDESIPTLSEWGLFFLAATLAVVGAIRAG